MWQPFRYHEGQCISMVIALENPLGALETNLQPSLVQLSWLEPCPTTERSLVRFLVRACRRRQPIDVSLSVSVSVSPSLSKSNEKNFLRWGLKQTNKQSSEIWTYLMGPSSTISNSPLECNDGNHCQPHTTGLGVFHWFLSIVETGFHARLTPPHSKYILRSRFSCVSANLSLSRTFWLLLITQK